MNDILYKLLVSKIHKLNGYLLIYNFFFFVFIVPATPGQISITGTDLKPSRFCENFLAPDTLPDPPEMRRKKNVNVTSTSKNVKKGKNAM